MTTIPQTTAGQDELAESGHLGPISKRIEVACAPERAFEVFTRECAAWWPLATHSVYTDKARTVIFGEGVGGEIVEHSQSGETASWGTVTEWQPGRRLVFDWHPGLPLDQKTRVEVTFTPTSAGTLVELVHSGWEKRDEPARRHAGYDSGWIPVVIRYAVRASDISQ